MSETEEERQARIERIAARKRYNMKSLGRLVDSNRLTGVARPAELDAEPDLPRRPRSDQDDEADADEFGIGETDDAEPASADLAESAVDEADESADAAEFSDDDSAGAVDGASEGIGSGDDRPEVVADQTLFSTDADADTEVVEAVDEPDAVEAVDEPDVAEAVDEPDVVDDAAVTDEEEPALGEDGVDRSGIGTQVTRTGLSSRVDESTRDVPVESEVSLARRMLEEETREGARISDPREVPGIVLDLASDIPASVAVSVVRIDEQVEIVGDTVDPEIDREVFSSVFSNVFHAVQPAAQVLADGPLGKVLDVVIEGERLDMILRPLGSRYYLMVLEERSRPEADLATTRRRMATVAPGLTAILTQRDGDA